MNACPRPPAAAKHRPRYPYSDAVPGRARRRLNAAGRLAVELHLQAYPEPTAFVRATYPALAAWAFAGPEVADECRAACLADVALAFAAYDAAHPSGACVTTWVCRRSRHVVRRTAAAYLEGRVPQALNTQARRDPLERADPTDSGRAAADAGLTVRGLIDAGAHLSRAEWAALLAHFGGTHPAPPERVAAWLATLRTALVPRPEAQ